MNIKEMSVKDLVEVNPQKMSGLPVFTGTRVPIAHLFEFLESGETLPEFLRQFPSVTREQALGVLELSKASLFATMKLLLDECVVHDLKRDLVGHQVVTVIRHGPAGRTPSVKEFQRPKSQNQRPNLHVSQTL